MKDVVEKAEEAEAVTSHGGLGLRAGRMGCGNVGLFLDSKGYPTESQLVLSQQQNVPHQLIWPAKPQKKHLCHQRQPKPPCF